MSTNICNPTTNIEKAVPKGCAVPKEINLEAQNLNIKSINKDKTSTASNKENTYSIIDKTNKGTIICDVLTLNNEEHIKKFNYILNEQNKEFSKSSIQVKILEHQYNDKLGTWQVLAIYETFQRKNFE